MKQPSALVVSAVAAIALLQPSSGAAQTSTSLDAKVQAPELSAPQRGSLAGQLSSVTFGPADVSRGAIALPSPFAVPTDRGALPAHVFPAYSQDAGISEWGMGWQVALAVTRSRLAGDLDYASDELTGPWGRMVQGSDGSWYPVGLSHAVRLTWTADTMTARLPDGTEWAFGGAARVTNAKGTYAWQLTSVTTVTGRKTTLAWAPNASGRQALQSVSWGGVGADAEYRLDLAYEPLATPCVDYRSGYPLQLDARVKKVTVLAKNASTGAFDERWHYDLAHLDDGFGPAFYLASVQQVFRSGEAPPPTRYGYNLARDRLASATLAPSGTAAFDPLGNAVRILTQLGSLALQPDKGTVVDVDVDGLPDLESAADYTLAHQTSAGVAFEALPPAPAASPLCRRAPSSANPPRVLAQLLSGAGDETAYVVDLRTDATRATTYVTVCDRPGNVVASTTASGDWVPSPIVRLVDLNRDHEPDLIRVQPGSYRVLLNSSVAGAVSFAPAKVAPLSPAVTPDTAWIQDMNGDGVPDLVLRYAGNLMVYYGKGNLEFAAGQTMPLRTLAGPVFAQLGTYAFSFVDANRDGMTDVLLSRPGGSYLLMNRGTYFQEVDVPALRSVGSLVGPYVWDVGGSGDTQLVYRGADATTGAPLAWGIGLDGPETGLLASADDGKGTVLRFGYARAAAAPGARARHAVVSRVEVQSSGYDTVAFDYGYASPRCHTVGKFLVGFDGVTRTDPVATESVQLMNEDRYAGVLVGSRTHDANAPAVDAFTSREYAEAPPFQGMPWKRLHQETTGFVDASGASIFETAEYLSYARDFCPETVRRTAAPGVLTVTKSYVQPAAFGAALSCVWGDAVEDGLRPDGAHDFTHETAVTRNDAGLVERVESVSGLERWTVETARYRPDWLVDAISSPASGTTTFAYAGALLQSVTSPDGVVVEALSRDPTTDAILTLRTTRGTAAHQEFYRFDGQERLARSWNDLGASTELAPAATYGYLFATAAAPAALRRSQLVDAARASTRDAVELVTAAGEPVVTASRIPEGWAFGNLLTRSRATAETRTSVRPSVDAAVDPAALDYASLLSGASQVGSAISSSFGHAPAARTTYHTGVERQVARTLALANGLLRLTTVENGTYATTTWMDAGKRVVAYDDEASVRHAYRYDALGRLREVTLPDGSHHRAIYDGHARVWRVEREGLPGAAQVAVERAFDPVTGRVETKRFLSAGDVLVRSVAYAYDAIGRVSTETHADAASGATKAFRYYYDGATPAQPTLRTTLGLLTGASGDGFTKAYEYRADGALTRRVVTLPGWRTVETALGYLESQVVGSRTVRVLDAVGTQLSAAAQAYLYDAYGRLESTTLNGAPFATFGYGPNGELRTATFAGTDGVTLAYDPLTRRFTGSTHQTPSYAAGTTQRMNERGLVGSETFSAGATGVSRTYDYSARRFLTSSADALATYGYAFDDAGLSSSITTNGVTATIARSGDTLTAGSVLYRFDALGRTVQRADLTLAYGPDGQLAAATRGAASWSFVHDEAGQRLLKRAGGVPVAAYLDEGYLDASGLAERVQVAGRTVGLLRNGVFTTAATDARGTVIADADGSARLASPFGARDVRPSSSAAIDYVEKGFDADLGLVRMGVRDYDPQLNRFVTADPLYLEQPERCLSHPVACNLYAYATNAPSGYVDPSGQYEEPVHGAWTWKMYQAAGFNRADATEIAVASAGVDYNPATKPTNFGNMLSGVTEEFHFNRDAPLNFWEQIGTHPYDNRALGTRTHTLEDVGYPDAPGPHTRGWTPFAIGHPFTCYPDGQCGSPLEHHADHPYHDVEGNRLVLRRVAEDVYKAGQARGYRVDRDTFMKEAEKEIDKVLRLDSNEAAYDYSRGYIQARDAWAKQNPGNPYPFTPGEIDTGLHGPPEPPPDPGTYYPYFP